MTKQHSQTTQREAVTMQEGAMKWQTMAVAFTMTGLAVLLLY